jgi:hypothetical protein
MHRDAQSWGPKVNPVFNPRYRFDACTTLPSPQPTTIARIERALVSTCSRVLRQSSSTFHPAAILTGRSAETSGRGSPDLMS